MAKAFKPKIVSANDLFDGDVVYLTSNGNWTRQIAKAAVAQEPDAAETLLARADQPAKVVGPYLLDVTLGSEGTQPEHFRERLRETGPTLSPEFSHVGHVAVLQEATATQRDL
jgi:hypothetical protein